MAEGDFDDGDLHATGVGDLDALAEALDALEAELADEAALVSLVAALDADVEAELAEVAALDSEVAALDADVDAARHDNAVPAKPGGGFDRHRSIGLEHGVRFVRWLQSGQLVGHARRRRNLVRCDR